MDQPPTTGPRRRLKVALWVAGLAALAGVTALGAVLVVGASLPGAVSPGIVFSPIPARLEARADTGLDPPADVEEPAPTPEQGVGPAPP